jgi:ABC-type phosphate/phosphonate transport system ATPase subunit
MARAYCDRIIGMTHGQITFDGPPEALTTAQLRRIYGIDGAADDIAKAMAQGHGGLLHETSYAIMEKELPCS